MASSHELVDFVASIHKLVGLLLNRYILHSVYCEINQSLTLRPVDSVYEIILRCVVNEKKTTTKSHVFTTNHRLTHLFTHSPPPLPKKASNACNIFNPISSTGYSCIDAWIAFQTTSIAPTHNAIHFSYIIHWI